MLDPPRAGAAGRRGALAALEGSTGRLCLLRSCDPRARRRPRSRPAASSSRAVELFEMFPHTSHVEIVGRFSSARPAEHPPTPQWRRHDLARSTIAFRREVEEFDLRCTCESLRRVRRRAERVRLRLPHRAASPLAPGRRSRFHLLQSLRADMRRSHPPTLFKIVERTIAEPSCFEAGDFVLVAVSGGPDSMALLHVLAKLAPRLGARWRLTASIMACARRRRRARAWRRVSPTELGVPFDVDAGGGRSRDRT